MIPVKKQVSIKLPQPHSKQIPVLKSKAKIRVIKAGRQSGKSTVALIIAVHQLLAGKQVAYITHIFDLSRKFYYQLLKSLPKELIVKSNSSSLSIELETGGTIQFYSGNATESLRGNTINFLIADEFAHWNSPEESYTQHISPILARFNGEMLVISSPLGKNYFYKMWLDAKQCTDGYMEAFYFTCFDNPFLSVEYLKRIEAKIDKRTWQQEYLALETANSNSICEAEDVEKNIIKQLSTKPAVCYGVDLAKTYDYSVIIALDEDSVMCHFDRFQLPWNQTMDKIKALPASIIKCIDSTGVGDVLVEQLSYTVPNIEGFKFTAQSKPQLIMGLIKSIELGEIKYTEEVSEELNNFIYKITSTGHIQYEAQNGHDDMVIALALANHIKKQVAINNSWNIYQA